MKYLVTGGAGFIGATVATMLMEAGHEVVVIDDCSRNSQRFVPAGAKLVRKRVHEVADVLDSSFDGVLHFAGLIAAGESVEFPERFWDNNAVGTLVLLETMRKSGVRKLVFSSSAGVYGNPESVPITEDAATNPVNAYSYTKLSCDMAIASEAVAHGLAAASLRYFNVAGAYRDKQGTWRGENHEPETHLIPIALEVAAGKRDKLAIFGDDYPTPDGTCVRDYIHVADLAQAHLLALDHVEAGEHRVYNLGSGTGYSNAQIAQAVARITGREIPVVYTDRRPGDPAELVASSQRAKSELGWKPTRDSLEQMVGDAWAYYQHTQA
ncbi:UDP-glucose 4-epimerase GalE [Natronoglycomyces albus]|uniref:UDP-glucose 4-epimerase GalE n=1 Tax=Natronoglycomyces albus TaxID=2811108 RepID=UPI001BCB7FE1|nr:UDP-glucose 4-epimerase GalE [Natronoglycomyces albus]